VQVNFTEVRPAVKLAPTGELPHSFIDLNNLVLARFSDAERTRGDQAHVAKPSELVATVAGVAGRAR
jgi:hypothetical protein